MPSKANTWGNFKPVSADVNYRLIWRSYGPEKVGKTHFGLTAPGPVAVQSFDIGLEGVVEKFLVEGLGPKEIVFTEYEFEKGHSSQDDAQDIMARFDADFETALLHARTIIWDTETELWEVSRYAEFGEASDAPKNYVDLNAKYRDRIQRAYDTGVNLQLIQKVKEKWATVATVDRNGRPGSKGSPTGIMEPTGFKESGYLTQANIEHTWNKENGFGLNILNCRQNMAVAGETFYDMDFPTFAQLVFPASEDSDWR